MIHGSSFVVMAKGTTEKHFRVRGRDQTYTFCSISWVLGCVKVCLKCEPYHNDSKLSRRLLVWSVLLRVWLVLTSNNLMAICLYVYLDIA